MALDPNSLRKASERAQADSAAQRGAEMRARRAKAVAGFPILLARFLAAVEKYIEAVAQNGGVSVIVLRGRGLTIEVSDYKVPDHPEVRATHAAANLVLNEIVELNDQSCGYGQISWGDLDIEDLNDRVAGHFQRQGFRVGGRVSYNGRFVSYSDQMSVSW